MQFAWLIHIVLLYVQVCMQTLKAMFDAKLHLELDIGSIVNMVVNMSSTIIVSPSNVGLYQHVCSRKCW